MFTRRGDQQRVASEPMCACVHVHVCMHVWVSACDGLAQNAGPPQEAGRLAARQAVGISSCAPGGVLSAALQRRVCTAQTVSLGVDPRAAGPPAVCSGGHGVLGGVGRRAGLGGGVPTLQAPSQRPGLPRGQLGIQSRGRWCLSGPCSFF